MPKPPTISERDLDSRVWIVNHHGVEIMISEIFYVAGGVLGSEMVSCKGVGILDSYEKVIKCLNHQE